MTRDLHSAAHNAHMGTYRSFLKDVNRGLAFDYIERNQSRIAAAIKAMEQAWPVALALREFNADIRRSPAADFWPIIRSTKGNLLFRPSAAGLESRHPWQRTKGGNMRFPLPGYLLFSPWPPGFQRRAKRHRSLLERFGTVAQDSRTLHTSADIVRTESLGAYRLLREMTPYQQFASAETSEALGAWSDEQKCFTTAKIRIQEQTLIFVDGSVRCEVPIPRAFANRIDAPPEVEAFPEFRWVDCGGGHRYL